MTKGTLPLSSITTRQDVHARQGSDLDHTLVRELVDAVRRKVTLAHLLVWREEDPDGTPTGTFVLLDGGHRLAAYKAAWGRKGQDRKVPVSLLTGPLMEAQLHALAANVCRKIGLTKRERVDRAWALVWEHGLALSKSRLAGAASIGVSTVAKMRARRLVMLEAGKRFTGYWSLDQRGEEDEGWTDAVPQERRDAITAAIPELRKLLRRKPQLPTEYVAEVLEELLGQFMLKGVACYLTDYDDTDEFEDSDMAEAPPENRETDLRGDF